MNEEEQTMLLDFLIQSLSGFYPSAINIVHLLLQCMQRETIVVPSHAQLHLDHYITPHTHDRMRGAQLALYETAEMFAFQTRGLVVPHKLSLTSHAGRAIETF